MTGTAISDATELEFTYELKVTPVPTALPIARRDYPDVAYKTIWWTTRKYHERQEMSTPFLFVHLF